MATHTECFSVGESDGPRPTKWVVALKLDKSDGGAGFWSDFHFVDRLERPASYPGIAHDFRQTFAT